MRPAGPTPQGFSATPASEVPTGDRMAPKERDAWTTLATVDGLGPLTFGRLLAAWGSGQAILATACEPGGTERLVAPLGGSDALSADVARRIADASVGSRRIVDRVREAGVEVMTLEEAAFPRRLLAIGLPPHLLFVRGDPAVLSAPRAVAVVGTRRPTEDGRLVAGWIGGALARVDAVVVSGLAVGIDGAAHAAVVAEERPTVAVLAGGHSHLYPRAHRRLAERMLAMGGAVISEMAPHVPPLRGLFARRNRLISGLSDATVIVEAPARSGALITATWALEQGRPCFVVPGPIDRPASAGCLALLRAYPDAVHVVAGIPELLDDLGLTDVTAGRPAGGPSLGAVLGALGGAERRVAAELRAGRRSVDSLAAGTGMPVGAILGVLTQLELRGLVVSAYGVYRAAGALASGPPPSLE